MTKAAVDQAKINNEFSFINIKAKRHIVNDI